MGTDPKYGDRLKALRLLLLLAFAASLGISATSAQNENPVTWSIEAELPAKPLKPSEEFTVKLIAEIVPGWHLYSTTQPSGGPDPTRITLPPEQPFKLSGALKAPPAQTKFDENFGINTELYEREVVFTLPVEVSSGALTGKQKLLISARFQACTESLCLPPKSVKLETLVEVAAATSELANPADKLIVSQAESKSTGLTSPPPAASALGAPRERSIAAQGASVTGDLDTNQSVLWFVWLSMTVGALSLLTPCVFPMVPITVSYFTNHAAGHRSAAIRDACIYALGIILTFTALGVTLALLFGAAGISQFAASPYVNLVIAAIFIGFALSLFGAYHLQVPSGVLTKLDSLSRNKDTGRIAGLLLMGLTFSLTSFTCTAPFVGTLLVMAAQGDWIYPVIGMLAFSTVFALPFFVLALAPQLLSQLPRSGGWLNSVKVVMGLLEVAAAMKFLSNVDLVWHWGIFTREVVLASWVAVTLLIAVYLLGKFKLTHDLPTECIGAVRLTTALVSLTLVFYLLTGLFGGRLGEIESFLPPATEGSTMITSGRANSGELLWIVNDYEGALAKAKEEKRPILIDFTGYTCTNCRWMEANMLPKEEVKKELEKYVRVRLYTDGEGEIYEKQQKLQETKFGTVALPYYGVVDPDGNVIAGFAGLTRNRAEFAAFLKQG